MNLFVRLLVAVLATASWPLAHAAHSPVRAVVRADRTNLRAHPSLGSEILASLNRGDTVESLGEVVPAGPKESWTRVELPPSVMIWAYSPGLSKAGKVLSSKLNFRVGPGKNYSVLGSLRKGDTVVIIREFDSWAQIAPPAGTVAYVASRLLMSPAEFAAEHPTPSKVPPIEPPSTSPREPLQQPSRLEPPAIHPVPDDRAALSTPDSKIVAATDSEPQATAVPPANDPAPTAPPVLTPDPEPSLPAPEPSPVPSIAEASLPTEITEPAAKPRPPVGSPKERLARENPENPVYPILVSDPDPGRPKPGETPPEPRQVVREGIVHRTISIQAPTDYELRDGFYEEGLIDYLFWEPQADLKKFLGKRVRVAGEEYLDSRWRTPVVKAQTIELAP